MYVCTNVRMQIYIDNMYKSLSMLSVTFLKAKINKEEISNGAERQSRVN